MRIKNLIVRNLGPIRNLDLELNGENVVFTGTNGSGKTFLISSLVDFIYENLSMIGFNDILPNSGNVYSYFRLTKSNYVTIGKRKGFIWINGEINGEDLYYLEQYGYETPEEISAEVGIPPEDIPWPNVDHAKKIKPLNESQRQKAKAHARNSAIFYVPASRYEEEFWKNEVFFSDNFIVNNATTDTLGRPIEIRTSAKENYTWLINELLDYGILEDQAAAVKYKIINELMGIILGRNTPVAIRVTKNRNNRIVVSNLENNELILNSLDSLSLGQTSIFYIFTNILRYGNTDTVSPQIPGLVIIDEIDTHLHDNLKRNALPKLIKLFPNVQFIITTHDPSCLISLEETESIPNIISLPEGEKIYASEYEELKMAREHLFTATKDSRELCENLKKIEKPILLVEDRYTELYKVAWLKLNDKNFSQENLEETFNEECPFCIVPANGCAKIRALLQRDYLIEKIKDKKLVALFDFDEAYIDFNNLPSELWGEALGEEDSGLTKNCIKYSNLHTMMLPIPTHRKNIASKKFKAKSMLEIELLFSDETLGNDCSSNPNAPGNFPHFVGDKDSFWITTVNYEKQEFSNFKPLFDKVMELLN